jgi:thioredoxin 1
MTAEYASPEPALADVQATPGWLLLEFGTPWCGHCRAAQPAIAAALGAHPAVRHVKVEDGSGRPLGRAYGVRLWPTLVLLRDGQEIGRAVRPAGKAPLEQLLAPAA